MLYRWMPALLVAGLFTFVAGCGGGGDSKLGSDPKLTGGPIGGKELPAPGKPGGGPVEKKKGAGGSATAQ